MGVDRSGAWPTAGAARISAAGTASQAILISNVLRR
jgi:hypothetical protein